MGTPVEGLSYILGDKHSVLENTSIPNYNLKKKSQSIAYYMILEGADRKKLITIYVKTHDNEADMLTKQLYSGENRKVFVRQFLHHIFGGV